MTDIWTAIAPSTQATRILATRGGRETILKANLKTSPQHPRALAAFLEALALWEGKAVRGALVADNHSTTSDTRLFHDYFAEAEDGPLFTLEVVWTPLKRRGRDGLSGLGDFRDLRRLLVEEVAR